MRVAALIAGVFLLCAASPPEPPPIPEMLKPYVKDGRLEPGDFGYLRHMLSDAPEGDDPDFTAFAKWQETCWTEAKARVRADLQAMGIADPRIENFSAAPLLCRMTSYWPYQPKQMTSARFQELRQRILPMAETYLVAVRQATSISRSWSATLADALRARPLGEQMLRMSMTWGQGAMADVPPLTPEEFKFFQARLGMEIALLDHENTQWLKKIVAEEGWPTISKVGERASMEAWLLVQHADADPVFQLQVLRLMEPLVAQGEVSKSNYAYLYDRIMLKLNGKQRYATQMTCEKGERIPLPLEDAQAAGRYRSEMGLNSLDDDIDGLNRSAGPCPST